MDVAEKEKIVSSCPEGWRVLAVAVPTTALRIIADDLNLVFRVEQLQRRPGQTWTWGIISTHAGTEAFESYPSAIKDMLTKQARLKEKIKLVQHEARMAQIKAENPLG